MRTRVLGAAIMAIGFAATSAQGAPLILAGSDTLEDVTNDVINVCDLGQLISYAGGGSGVGEGKLTSGVQQIAPMSRQLNKGVRGGACGDSATQLLIGLDGIAILTANQLFGDSLNLTPDDPTDDCSDSIQGGMALSVPGCTPADGCSTPGTYVFNDWADVLAMVYGGQNHVPNSIAPQLLMGGARNPARINCAGPVRQALVNNWAAIFSDAIADPQSCRTDSCLKLKHAFRRGDQSGTTDTFVTLAGMIPIPPFTTTTANLVPSKDSFATANPFCNAGEAVMNKGDSDYLDLDPIRRIADSEVAALARLGLEQVAEGYAPPSNPPTIPGIDDRVEPAVTLLADYAVSTEQNILPDPNLPSSLALEQAALTMRKGLGVVLPIEIPGNFNDETVMYYSPSPSGGEPVLCSVGKFAPSLADGQHPGQALCPDGSPQPCLLPVNLDNPAVPNFNCLTNSPVPASPPVRDARVYNLLVVNSAGKYVRDSYVNPNLPTLTAVRQNRVVSAFFRLHVSQTTYFGGFPPGINCKKFTSTDQIGCLVEANPCSIGYAGREAADGVLNVAFEVQGVRPTADAISNLVNGSGQPVYPLARALWVNSVNGFSSVTGNELSLLKCFEGQQPGVRLDVIDSIVTNRNFVQVPPNIVNRVKSCPATFP